MNGEDEMSNKEYEIILPWSDVWEKILSLLRSEEESVSVLQALLKYRQISPLYRNEIDAHIRYKINDPSVTSMFDHIFLAHIIFGTLEEVQKFIKRNKLTVDYMVRLNPIVLHQQKLYQYNMDMIRWLIDFGLDASGCIVTDWHIEFLPTEWNVYMLEKGAVCQLVSLDGFRTVEQFRQYWKYFDITPQVISKLTSRIFVFADDFRTIRTNERKEFILNEYRSASSNNLFKALPIEIIQQICSYELDDLLWLEITDIMIKEVPDGSLEVEFGWYGRISEAILRFVWKCWDKFSDKTKKSIARQVVQTSIPADDDQYYESLLKFFRLPITENAFPSPNNDSVLPAVLCSIMSSKHPKALDLLKVVVETHQYKPGAYETPYSDRVPHVWYCLYSDNIPMIQYLIDIDSWPLQNEYGKFDDWINHRRPGLKAETLESCLEYLRKNGKIDSNYGQNAVLSADPDSN